MCVEEHKLSDSEAVELLKDYTVENAREAIEFYIITNTNWNYHSEEQLLRSFESGEIFSSSTNVSGLRKWKTSLTITAGAKSNPSVCN